VESAVTAVRSGAANDSCGCEAPAGAFPKRATTGLPSWTLGWAVRFRGDGALSASLGGEDDGVTPSSASPADSSHPRSSLRPLPLPSPRSSPLRDLQEIASEVGDEDVARDARELAGRLEEGRFHVACIGQFKRGKSTLINAIIGSPILPTGVVPITSAITVVRHGNAPLVRVSFEDGRVEDAAPADLSAFVSESENPGNSKGVRVVEVFFPSPLLELGLCLVDTPGLGSPFGGNAEVTRAYVPHVDAGLVVLGADPPLSGDELDLVAKVAAEVPHLVFVLNKSDRLSGEERQEGARFASDVLSRRLGMPVGPLLEVSARERLDLARPTRDWPELERTLQALAHEAGADIVLAAGPRGVARLTRALLRTLDERRDALLRPLAESEARLALLRSHVDGAREALGDLRVLLSAESARLEEAFRTRHQAFLALARGEASRQLEESARALECSRNRLRGEILRIAQELARRVAERFRLELEPIAEDGYRRAMERFVLLGNEFLARVAASGEPGLDALPPAVGAVTGLRLPGRIRYTELLSRTLSLTAWIRDPLLPRSLTMRSALAQTSRYLDDLIEANSSRVAADLVERVAGSRARLEAELRDSLTRVTSVAEKALERAGRRRAEGEASVEEELRSIAKFRAQLTSLLQGTQEGEQR